MNHADGVPEFVAEQLAAMRAREARRQAEISAEREQLTPEAAWEEALAVNADLQQEAAERLQRRLVALERSFLAKIPRRFHDASLSDYGGSRLEASAAALVERARSGAEGAGISIVGPIGSGKTHLAVAVLRALYVSPGSRPFHMAPMREVLEDYKATFDGGRQLTFAYETDPATLLIDDPWADRDTDFNRDILARIVASRYDRCLPTWITANADIEKLRGADERTASRLLEMNGRPVVLRLADRRRAER